MDTELFVKLASVGITIVSIILTYVVVPYLKQRTTKEQQDSIEYWIRVAVEGAEQIFTEPNSGAKKKEYVLNFINDKFKLKLSKEQLDLLIEKLVFEMNLYFKE